MKPATLKLKAAGHKLIHDFTALQAGVGRYIGRRWDVSQKGWPASDEPSIVKPLAEYVKAVQVGDLLPGDEETAKYCGVTFSE